MGEKEIHLVPLPDDDVPAPPRSPDFWGSLPIPARVLEQIVRDRLAGLPEPEIIANASRILHEMGDPLVNNRDSFGLAKVMELVIGRKLNLLPFVNNDSDHGRRK